LEEESLNNQTLLQMVGRENRILPQAAGPDRSSMAGRESPFCRPSLLAAIALPPPPPAILLLIISSVLAAMSDLEKVQVTVLTFVIFPVGPSQGDEQHQATEIELIIASTASRQCGAIASLTNCGRPGRGRENARRAAGLFDIVKSDWGRLRLVGCGRPAISAAVTGPLG